MDNERMKAYKIAVVLPVYNEEGCIEKLLSEIENSLNIPLEFVLVDDGSQDSTLAVLQKYKMNKSINRKKIIVLSRNFGHQQALMCGLHNVPDDTDLVLLMDSDFQDMPQDIPLLLEKLKDGYDCVYAVRSLRSEGILMHIFTKIFYRIQVNLASFSIPPNAGTFCVFNRKILEKILMFQETDIYFPALRAYVGYKQAGVLLKRGKRACGKSRVDLTGLIDLSITAILHFSAAPMRMIFWSGLMIMLFCFVMSLLVLMLKIIGITKIPGITTSLIIMMMFSGIQIMFLGVVGEYIGKMFRETKKRPRWLIKEVIGG